MMHMSLRINNKGLSCSLEPQLAHPSLKNRLKTAHNSKRLGWCSIVT